MTVLKFLAGFLVIPAFIALLYIVIAFAGIVWVVGGVLFIGSICMGLGCAGFFD